MSFLQRKYQPGFGDALLFPYCVVIARQYLWSVNNNMVAWGLAIIAATLLWMIVLRLKPEKEAPIPWQFWLVVAAPLFVVYAMRVAIPDTSYDVLNYRLVGGERALRGLPFLAGDFFPPFYPLNPAPDMLLGISRRLLGYRLGTLFNFLVLLWTGTILLRIFRRYLANRWVLCLAALATLWTEHILFIINNYLVDLLALPLLLEALCLALGTGEAKLSDERLAESRLLRIGFFLGLSVTLKVLNLAYAIPIAAVYLHSLLVNRKSFAWRRVSIATALSFVLFLLPLAPYSIYMLYQTGNPVFPLYNGIFKSEYWPSVNLYDGRWGAVTTAGMLTWPLRVAYDTSRIGELPAYSGRISLAVIAALMAAGFWRDHSLRALGLATLLGALLWSAALTGYARYATFAELIGGALIIGLTTRLWAARPRRGARRFLGLAIALTLLLGMIVQIGRATNYVLEMEWSQRPTVFRAPQRNLEEGRLILRDYEFGGFLDEEERHQLAQVDMWVESGPLTSGFQSLITPDAPILCAYIPDYFYAEPGKQKFANALAAGAGHNLASLCVEDQMEACKRALAARGLSVVENSPITMLVYSRQTRLRLQLLKLGMTSQILKVE